MRCTVRCNSYQLVGYCSSPFPGRCMLARRLEPTQVGHEGKLERFCIVVTFGRVSHVVPHRARRPVAGEDEQCLWLRYLRPCTRGLYAWLGRCSSGSLKSMTASSRSAKRSGVLVSCCLRRHAAQRGWAMSAWPSSASESGSIGVWRWLATRRIASVRTSSSTPVSARSTPPFRTNLFWWLDLVSRSRKPSMP